MTIYALIVYVEEECKLNEFDLHEKGLRILRKINGGSEIGRMTSKAFNNIYCKARLKAAESNLVFQSRESTAYELNISMDSLISYELDLWKSVPPDRVVLMAEAYNASYLLENYCCSCSIGKLFTEQSLLEKLNNNHLV